MSCTINMLMGPLRLWVFGLCKGHWPKASLSGDETDERSLFYTLPSAILKGNVSIISGTLGKEEGIE